MLPGAPERAHSSCHQRSDSSKTRAYSTCAHSRADSKTDSSVTDPGSCSKADPPCPSPLTRLLLMFSCEENCGLIRRTSCPARDTSLPSRPRRCPPLALHRAHFRECALRHAVCSSVRLSQVETLRALRCNALGESHLTAGLVSSSTEWGRYETPELVCADGSGRGRNLASMRGAGIYRRATIPYRSGSSPCPDLLPRPHVAVGIQRAWSRQRDNRQGRP